MARTDAAPMIESIIDIASIVRDLPQDRRFLFRGQNTNESLLPRFAREVRKRNLSSDNVVVIERRMLDRFKKESFPFLQNLRPETDFDWLSIAQHYGLPTRLLDWTGNALAALWFAVASDPEPGVTEGVIWVLEVEPKNEKKPSRKESPFQLNRTYIFQPFHIDRRIAAQVGWFSIHRYAEDRGKFYALNNIKIYKPNIQRYPVPVSAFDKLRAELRLLVVTQATMFPDLAGLCAEIQADCLGSFSPTSTI